jgi:hypothetical protein
LIVAPVLLAGGYLLIRAVTAASPVGNTPAATSPPAPTEVFTPIVLPAGGGGTPQGEPTVIPTPIQSGVCPDLLLFPLQVKENEATWLLDNQGSHARELLDMSLTDWPTANGVPERVMLGEGVLWEGENDSQSSLTFDSQAGRVLPAGAPSLFSISFRFPAGSQGMYWI